MSPIKSFNRPAGFIATLAAGIVLLVAEGASAGGGGGNDSGRGRGGETAGAAASSARNTAPVSTCRACRVVKRDGLESEREQAIPSNDPRRVQPDKFTPSDLTHLAPADTPLVGATVNPLAGKPLRYLIGTDSPGPGRDDEVTVVSYDTTRPAKYGISIAYGNLFDERNTGRYGPYLLTSDTATQYGEGQIDPRGPGWEKNLREQLARRRQQGFEYIELDNSDAYSIKDVIGAIELAASYGLKVIAKNPGLMRGATAYVAHPNIHGTIVEKGAGGPADMDALRRKAGKPLHLAVLGRS
jgi:hypothetical protein